MTAYYNENDPFAAQWLRNLISAGHIAPGDVDDRGIEEINADDLRKYTQCHFFAGIGVWSYALRRAGWPDDRPVWTGSCPCQPFSGAGKREGIGDPRHLWPVWFRLIRECRPGVIIGEQVSSVDGLVFWDIVSHDLESEAYAAGAVDTCVPGVGGPHIRQRLYWLADAMRPGRPQGWPRTGSGQIAGCGTASRLGNADREPAGRDGRSAHCAQAKIYGADARHDNGLGNASRASGGLVDAENDHGRLPDGRERQPVSDTVRPSEDCRTGPLNGFWQDADWLFCTDGRWRPVEPGSQPLASGVANRVGKLRAYGNAINAEQATQFIEAVIDVFKPEEEKMNAIVHKKFNSPAAMADYASVLAAAADAIPVGSGGLPILKLVQQGKDAGYFSFGEAATPVSDEDLWAVNPFHILRGYICFSQKNEVLGEVCRPITADPIDYDKLPVHYGRDKRGKEIELEWQPQIVLHMQCIAGPNEGASVVFKPTSGGGMKLCRTVLHEIAKRFAKGTDKPVPTGFLTAESYTSKFDKVTWNPLLEFDKWVDMEFADAESAAEPVADDEPEAAEPKRGRAAAEPKRGRAAAESEAEEAPRSRSRSRDAEEAEVIEDEPKRGRGRPRNEDKEADAPRSRGRQEDAEEAPRGRTRGEPAPRRGRQEAEPEAEEAPRGRGRPPRR